MREKWFHKLIAELFRDEEKESAMWREIEKEINFKELTNMAKHNNYKAKKNTGFKVLCVLLAVLTVAASIACALGWVKAVKLEKQVNTLIQEREDDAEKIPMTFTTYGIVEEDYEKYGIPARATSTKLIVADFEPAGTTDKRCRWTIGWKDGSTTLPIDEYVSFNPAENNGASCAVGCLKPFTKTLVITCTSVANAKITSKTNLEYVTRYDDVCDGGDYEMAHFDDAINIFWGYNIDEGKEGTVTPDAYEADVNLILNTGLYGYLTSRGADVATRATFNNITGAIPSDTSDSSGWQNDFNALYPDCVAEYCIQNNTNYIGEIEIEMRCYYQGELIYEFSTSRDWTLTDACILEMSVPPQSVTTPPSVVF